MVGVGRQLFVPLSLAVGFAMIASYLLSSTLVPVFSTWLMQAGASRRGARGLFGGCARSTSAICESCCASAGRWSLVYLAVPSGLLYRAAAAHGHRDLSRRERAAASAPPARADRHAHRGDRAIVLQALDVIKQRGRPGQRRRSPATSSACSPPSYPVNTDSSVHQRPAGSGHSGCAEARRAARRSAAGTAARRACSRSCPTSQVSFEAGDIVSQVMSFGSPTPIEVAVQGISLADDYALSRRRSSAQLAKLPFLRDLQFAQALNYPDARHQHRSRARRTVRPDHGRRRRARSCPPPRPRRFTEPNYWRDPDSRQRVSRSRWRFRRTGCRASTRSADLPVMQDGAAAAAADRRRRRLKLGTMPGLIERYNRQRVVSLTANIHGMTLGEAARRLNAGDRARRRAAARRHGRDARPDPAARADHLRPAHRPAARGRWSSFCCWPRTSSRSGWRWRSSSRFRPCSAACC